MTNKREFYGKKFPPNRWEQLKQRLRLKKAPTYQIEVDHTAELPPVEIPPALTGGVVRANKRTVFTPDIQRRAMVRAMPKELQRIKESQETIKEMPGE